MERAEDYYYFRSQSIYTIYIYNLYIQVNIVNLIKMLFAHSRLRSRVRYNVTMIIVPRSPLYSTPFSACIKFSYRLDVPTHLTATALSLTQGCPQNSACVELNLALLCLWICVKIGSNFPHIL